MRFKVVQSNIVDNGWFVKDTVGTMTFPTSTNKIIPHIYCKALNKLYEEMGGDQKMNEEIKMLLEDIRRELDGLYRYKAFIAYYGGMGKYEVLSDDVIDLNFKDLIKRIDEVISDVES